MKVGNLFWIITATGAASAVGSLAGCSKEPTGTSSVAPSPTSKPSDAKVNHDDPIVERARTFDLRLPWKDFTEDERKTLQEPLPPLTTPGPLPETAHPPDVEKPLAAFEAFVRASAEAKADPRVVDRVKNFKEYIGKYANEKGAGYARFAEPRQGGWFKGGVEAEAAKVYALVADYHRAKEQGGTNVVHNKRAKELVEKWEAVHKKAGVIDWAKEAFGDGLRALGLLITELRAAEPNAVLLSGGINHPLVQGFREAYEDLGRALSHKFAVYLPRLPYFAIKRYAASIEAERAGNHAKALNLVSSFLWGGRGSAAIPDVDLSQCDFEVGSACSQESAKIPEHLVKGAEQLLVRLRGRVRPATEAQAIMMYQARDFTTTSKPAEVSPGTWCAFRGKYEGEKSGYHMIRHGTTAYIAFHTSENLSHVPDGTTLTVVGQYERQMEFQRVLGNTGRCPVVKDAVVLRDR